MPALDAQMPSSTSAEVSARTRRAVYGAPEAPVMPRKTRTAGLFRAFGFAQEHAELMQLQLSERGELRHHVVAELRRVCNVFGEEVRPLTALSDRRQVWCAEVGAAGAEVGVAGGTAGSRKDVGPGDGVRIVGEALTLRPRGHGLHDLAGEGLLRGRPLVRHDTHRDHDQDGG